MRATVVVDLGFGDAGKGLLTDYLVRETGARLVVRYNGGAQAGHNVVTADGRRHTFSQLGSGSFVDGVRTFLSRHVVLHPTALLREAEVLSAKGVADPLRRVAVSRSARVVTPFHQALGRLRELARGTARHGSCGVGVGETVGSAISHPEDAIRAGDLAEPALLGAKLRLLGERKRRQAEGLLHALPPSSAVSQELAILHQLGVAEAWMKQVAVFADRVEVAPDAALASRMQREKEVVFEGAQGVLLDEWHGFHPHTTWSDCTAGNALELIAEAAPGAEVRRLGVVRSHAVRHGAGPLPSEHEGLADAIRDHNQAGPWQGAVRYGWFDAVLVRYALDVAGPFDALAVTHLDVPARLAEWRFASAYRIAETAGAEGLLEEPCGKRTWGRLTLPAGRDLARQERLTRLLGAARPVYRRCEPSEGAVLDTLEDLVGQVVSLVARGPTAGDVAPRSPAV